VDVISFVNHFTNSAGLASAEDLSLFNLSTAFRVRARAVGLTLRARF
jgi:hypothetical protein